MAKENGASISVGYAISRETLNALDDMHKLIALELIKQGVWRLKPSPANSGPRSA